MNIATIVFIIGGIGILFYLLWSFNKNIITVLIFAAILMGWAGFAIYKAATQI